MARTTLSIVIPTLNEASRIGGLLESLQPARGAGAEIIVVDGESDDGTVTRARAGADAVLRTRPGRARQMIAGAAAARGQVLWFLHADSDLAPEATTALLDVAARGDTLVVGEGFDGRVAELWMASHACQSMILNERGLFEEATGIFDADDELFARTAHTLKSNCKTFGAYDFAELAFELEIP